MCFLQKNEAISTLINAEAERYYQITEDSYLSLTDPLRPFMNLGDWQQLTIDQAISLAQLRLVQNTVHHALAEAPEIALMQGRLLEIGPGWGGSRSVLQEMLPGLGYVGLNCSARQVAYARELNRNIPRTHYDVGFIESLSESELTSFDVVFGIESFLHVKEKSSFFRFAAKAGVKAIVLAEICLEDENVYDEEPLFNPALRWTVSTDYYRQTLLEAGFSRVITTNIGSRVFDSWALALQLRLAAKDTNAHPRVLRDFVRSYESLAKFYREGRVSYPLIVACK